MTPVPLEVPYKFHSYQHSFSYFVSQYLIQPNDFIQIIQWEWEEDCLIYQPNYLPASDSGRVKWWRKKVRDDTCPPILVWYQSQLQGYFLIDGYARLQAYLAENTVPNVLVITPTRRLQQPIDLDKRHQMLLSLKNNLTYSKTPLPLEKINRVLVQAFDDNTYFSAKGSAKPIKNLDERWLEELKSFKDTPNVDYKLLQEMMGSNLSYLKKRK